MGKRESTIAKGLAVAMMLFHHLFLNEQEIMSHGGNLTLLFLNQDQLISIAQSFKACVSVFVLISGYGMCVKLRRINGGGYGLHVASRLVKLLLHYQVIYITFLLIGFLYPVHNASTVYGSLWNLRSWILLIIDFFGLATAFQTPTLNATWWYMSVAILLIAIAPIMYEFGKKFGYGTVIIVSLIGPMLMGLISTSACRYLFVFCIGMSLAESGLVDRYENWKAKNRGPSRYLLTLLTFLMFVFLLYARQIVVWCDPLAVIAEAVCAVLMCVLATELPSMIGTPIFILGKHSMNIFLLHTFIFGYYWSQLIYVWNYPALIFIALLVLSLAFSWAIEKYKTFIRFDRLVEIVSSRVTALPLVTEKEG